MIPLDDWAEIRVLHRRDKLSRREIARQLGISRTTVDRALASDLPPKYSRPPIDTSFAPFEARVRALLAQTPSMPATVLAERVEWTGGASTFRRHVAELRPMATPIDPADRISYRPGDQAQCDLWFPPVQIPLGGGKVGTPPVLVMVPSFSAFISARMIPSRCTEDLLAGSWVLIEGLGAVPARLVWDGEGGIGRGRRLTEQTRVFAGSLATRVHVLKPRDPESKGVVERMNEYFETSFMPGRTFSSPQDFNTQLQTWLQRANQRRVRRIGARPAEVIAFDRAAMLPLPPVAPTVGFHNRVRLGRDYYVRIAGNDYSVDPRAIGRFVDVHARLEQVTVRLDGQVIATHARCWTSGLTITDPAHVAAAKTLRLAFQAPRSTTTDSDLQRDLADYDTAFGVHFETQEGVA